MRFKLVALLCLVTAGTLAAGDRVDDYVKTAMFRQHIPGLSLAVVYHGKIVKCRGYGLASIELNVPATADSVYELASLTKSFVSNVVFLLKQDGKLSLDDKASNYIQGLPETWKSITIRHLLSHTSGIPDYANDLLRQVPHDASPEQILEIAKAAPLKSVPGSKWTYSNTDYILLGMIIQKITGRTYDEILATRVFKPLGMTSTRRDSPDEVLPNRVDGYLWYGPAAGIHNANFLTYMETNHGDRGIVSTVRDLAKWDAALSTEMPFTKETKKEMWSPITLNDGSTYFHGLGWFMDKVNGHLHISHAGGSPGTATIFARYPDDELTVIVLANGGADNIFALDGGVAQCYVPALGPQGIVTVAQRVLDSYTGYRNVWGGQLLSIVRNGSSLVVDDGGTFTGAFKPTSPASFVAEDCDRGMKFKGDALTIRLGDWNSEAQLIGPLASSLVPKADPDPARTLRIEKILRAFERGGSPVEAVDGIAPQARKDYARGPAPEFAGFQSISYIAEFDLANQKIERHGDKVSRVLYFQLRANGKTRIVLVYLTPGGLVTDQDVVDR